MSSPPSPAEGMHSIGRRRPGRFMLAVCLALAGALGLYLPGSARAASPIEAWRLEAGQTRILAENDPPRAYQEAQRLERSLPADATPADRARVWNLLSRAELYLALTDPAAEHARLALDLAAQHGDRIGQAEAQLTTTLIAINQSKIDTSVAAATRSMELLEGVNRPDLLSEALLRMSMTYRRLGDLDNSVTMAMQAMEMAKRSKDPLALTYAHQGLAISFDQSNRYQEAGEHYARMRAQARAAPSKWLEAHAIRGLGGITAALGDAAGGERLMREAVAMFRALQVPTALGYGLYGLASSVRALGRHAEAVPILDEVIAIYAQYQNQIGLWWGLEARSEDHQALGHLVAARADAQRAYALAQQINVPLYKSESAKRLAALTAAAGDHRKAYQFSVEASDMVEQAARERTNARMVELAQRYETESKQREINELTHRNEQQSAELRQRALQQRWLWTMLGGAAVVLAGGAYFLLRQRRSNRMLEAANTQVQRSQNQLRATLDAVPDPLFELDLDGRYYDVHPLHSDLLVAPADVLIGKTVSDIMPPEAAGICLSALREAHEQGLSMGKEFELTLPHGKAWFEFSVARKQVAAGKEPRFICLSRDITERKRTEEALREREQRYRGIFDNVLDTLYLLEVTPDGHFRNLEVNPAFEKSSGISSAELVGKLIEETVPEAIANIVITKYRRCIEAGTAIDEEVSLEMPNGLRHYHSTLIPVRDDSGRIHRIVGISRDITERKALENDLKESQHLLRQLAARNEVAREDERKHLTREIHDEMGQYLLALRIGVSVVDLQFGVNNPLLQEKTQRLIAMVDTTIKVVRNMVASLRPAALNMGIVSALEWLVGEYSERTGLQCELRVCEEDIQLNDTCTTALFRIVQESLTNIVRHAQASKVEITFTRNEAHYFLEVRDNGRGFNPTVRKEKSFGLVSIRERALMLGGEVDITSAPGQATAIRVHIPILNVLSES